MSGLYGNVTGGFGMPKTFILTDDNGNEITGVVVGEETVFTAELNDIRAGKTAANSEGVVTGTKDIPIYRTKRGVWIVDPGSVFSIPCQDYDQYNYTQLQCVIAPFNTSIDDSIAVDKVVINNGVLLTQSTSKMADVTKNSTTKSIDLNITNDSDDIYVIHYFTYKEEE